MNNEKALSIYFVLGLVVSFYCSHAFGLKPLAQNYHTVKPELTSWHFQTTPSNWYGYEVIRESGRILIGRVPSIWDFFVELVIFLSGSLAFVRTETATSSSRNIVLIVKSFCFALLLIVAGIILESLNTSTTVLPGNSLLVWLGILTFFGRLWLFLPLRKCRYIVPLGLLFLCLHWMVVQYGFGNSVTKPLVNKELATEASDDIASKSVWENESGVFQRVSLAFGRILPKSVRSSGLTTDYANYSEINLIAYTGLYLLGIAAGMICISVGNTMRILLLFSSLAVGFIGLSILLQLSGLPAVPRLASATHILLACGFGYLLLTIGSCVVAVKYGPTVCHPIIAIGTGSALLYMLERGFGVAFRTEVDKHLEPLLEPVFNEQWLQWEPIVFYNIVFLVFATTSIYLHRKKVQLSF